MSAVIKIGTSGFDYPEWKGVFYPEKLPRKDFASYYASVFDTLELNSTFYSMPTPERLLSLSARTGTSMSFSIKANRLLTHEISRSWQDDASLFRAAVSPLLEAGRLETLLFQFPQSFHYDVANRCYLADLISFFSGFPVAVEFRHADWVRQSVFQGLDKMGSSLVFCDMPNLRHLPDGLTLGTPFVGKLAYVRLHGRNAGAWYSSDGSPNGSSRYEYDYSEEELAQFITVIRNATEEGKHVAVYFNNHPQGKGAKNAQKLKELVVQAGL